MENFRTIFNNYSSKSVWIALGNSSENSFPNSRGCFVVEVSLLVVVPLLNSSSLASDFLTDLPAFKKMQNIAIIRSWRNISGKFLSFSLLLFPAFVNLPDCLKSWNTSWCNLKLANPFLFGTDYTISFINTWLTASLSIWLKLLLSFTLCKSWMGTFGWFVASRNFV